MTMMRGGNKRDTAIAVGVPQVCFTRGENVPQNIVATLCRRIEERRILDCVLGIDVGAGIDQEPGCLGLVGASGNQQRGARRAIARINVLARISPACAPYQHRRRQQHRAT